MGSFLWTKLNAVYSYITDQ